MTQKLEEMNSSPKISQKVRGTHRQNIKRKSLGSFKKFLDIENPERISFLSGNHISDEDLSIDHVIPWSYLYSDDLWNLVYVDINENSSKNNAVPSEETIRQLEDRNRKLLEATENLAITSKHVEELKLSLERDYVRKFWVGCKG